MNDIDIDLVELEDSIKNETQEEKKIKIIFKIIFKIQI